MASLRKISASALALALAFVACVSAERLAAADAIVDVRLTAENAHKTAPTCPPGYSPVPGSSVADCGLGKCYGIQQLCVLVRPLQQLDFGDPIVNGLYLTMQGAHVVGSPGCPGGGYVATSSLADCGGAKCNGNQVICQKALPLGQNACMDDKVIDDVYLTAQGAHTGTPTCAAGYQVVGSLADCGYGWCYGSQLLCARYTSSLFDVFTP